MTSFGDTFLRERISTSRSACRATLRCNTAVTERGSFTYGIHYNTRRLLFARKLKRGRPFEEETNVGTRNEKRISRRSRVGISKESAWRAVIEWKTARKQKKPKGELPENPFPRSLRFRSTLSEKSTYPREAWHREHFSSFEVKRSIPPTENPLPQTNQSLQMQSTPIRAEFSRATHFCEFRYLARNIGNSCCDRFFITL